MDNEHNPMIEQFLEELAELSEKYNLAIGGCGCCGSPYIYTINTKLSNTVGFDLEYNEHTKKYKCET